ncbi:unnamed protein product [Sphagnum tenellum]
MCNCGMSDSNLGSTEHPWQVMLNPIKCQGTIINERWVITVAHCTNGYRADQLELVVGMKDDESGQAKVVRVKRIVMHPQFIKHKKTGSLAWDYCLLELANPLEWSPKVRPACLPQDTSNDYAGAIASVKGWGDSEKKTNRKLTALKVMGKEHCGKYRDMDHMSTMCASGIGMDSCHGDSGGKLYMKAIR